MRERFGATAAVDVRAECKRRFGRACVLIYGPDMETVVQELDCRGNWCPALKRVIEEAEDDIRIPRS